MALVGGLICVAPHAASAQPDPLQRPFRGLFGSGSTDANSSESLALDLSAFGSYDDDLLSDARQTRFPGSAQGGYFGGGSAQLSYARSGERSTFHAQGATTMRYHPDQRDLNAPTVFAGLGFGVPFGTRTHVRVAATGFKAPRYQLGLLGSLAPDVQAGDVLGDAYTINRRDALGGSTTVSASQQLTTRTSFSANYGFRLVDYAVDATGNVAQHTAGAYVQRTLTAYSTARLGYQYRQHSLTIDGQPFEEHNIVAGVDYSRPWSLSGRRTQLTLHPGWSLARLGGELRLRATGSAVLDHQIGRSWTAQLEYSRGLRSLDGLDVYAFADQARAGVSGLLGRRVDIVAGGAYLAGNYGRGDTAGLRTYTGNFQMRVALTRILALYGRYHYYTYEFDRPELLPGWFSGTLERHGVRVGLTAHLPLIR
jgi:hypothetical protein